MSNPDRHMTDPGHGRIYLDHNATTPLHKEVAAEMIEALELWGNPSSIHQEGRWARALLERSRRRVAAALAASPEELLFASGGTEADCLGVIGLFRTAVEAGRPPRLLVPGIEHPAVLGAAAEAVAALGGELVEVPVDSAGRAEPDALRRALDGGAALVCVAAANHELGTVQEIASLADVARECGALFFCDAVQAFGKRPLAMAELGADAVAVSGHKIYGPKGIGALWVRDGLTLPALVAAGHQERERRPGTENVIGAVGFGAAAERVEELLMAQPRIATMAARLRERALDIPGAREHGAGDRVAGTLNLGFDGAVGEAVVQALDLAGVAVSTGAACTSGSVKPSAVLLAIGENEERAREAVRISLGHDTTDAEVDRVASLLPEVVERVRRFAR